MTRQASGGAVRAEEAERFFRALYQDEVSEDAQLVLWESKTRRCRWISSFADAVGAVEGLGGSDTYYGVCLQSPALARERAKRVRGRDVTSLARTRGSSATAIAIPGVWLDVDVGGEGHKKQHLPPTSEDARSLIAELPFVPSLLVATGGGFHAYWLFDEPHTLESDAERARLHKCVVGWQSLAINLGRQRWGWEVDATHDLARVLRPAGTWSYKHGCQVEIVDEAEVRYHPSQFEEWAVGDVAAPHVGVSLAATPVGAYELRDDLSPDALRLTAMLTTSTAFRSVWERKRTFPSQSEYDMSLASMAAAAGWKDQDVVALLVAHRRGGGHSTKADRRGYYDLLLQKVRATQATAEAVEEVEALGAAVERSRGAPDPEMHEEAVVGALRGVSMVLGVDVVRVHRWPGDTPTFSLETPAGEFEIGAGAAMLSFDAFRGRLAGHERVVLAPALRKGWHTVAQTLIRAAEDVDLGPDTDARELAREHLESYLERVRPRTAEERDDALARRLPFEVEGGVAFFLQEAVAWLSRNGAKVERGRFAKSLKSLGVGRTTVHWTPSPGKRTTRLVWVLPSGPPAGGLQEEGVDNQDAPYRAQANV